MIYVTHGYTTNQFETDEQALSYVKAEMDKEELSYLPVYDHTDEYGVRVHRLSILYALHGDIRISQTI